MDFPSNFSISSGIGSLSLTNFPHISLFHWTLCPCCRGITMVLGANTMITLGDSYFPYLSLFILSFYPITVEQESFCH